MLVLSRKCPESIIIGDDIIVTVVETRRHDVKLRILAPNKWTIQREEQYLPVQDEPSSSTDDDAPRRRQPRAPQGNGLTLKRRRDESIIIGSDIRLTIVDIRGDRVRIGIKAPIEISVHRQEVYEAIQRENRQAEWQPED